MFSTGSEDRTNLNAEAFEKLRHVASLSSPVSAIASPGSSVESLHEILKKVHSARDKHIFRCESTDIKTFCNILYLSYIITL